MNQKVFIIAEAGVNHNGRFEEALRLVDAAKEAGADSVKFQTFDPKKLVRRGTSTAAYQEKNTGHGDQFQLLERLVLSLDELKQVARHCEEIGIEFMSTPFDVDSLRMLIDHIGLKRIKLSSGDLTNVELLYAASLTNLPIILSTGMATLSEIYLAVAFVDFVRSNRQLPSSFLELSSYSNQLRTNGATIPNLDVLHCTTEYPAPLPSVNLRAIKSLAESLCLPIGYSDHTEGVAVSLAAAALGACVVEKHFTMDKRQDGPDHKASIEPHELKQMVEQIRSISLALGSEQKMLNAVESANKKIVRRGIYAARNLQKGDLLSMDALQFLRPENNDNNFLILDYLGKSLGQSVGEGGAVLS